MLQQSLENQVAGLTTFTLTSSTTPSLDNLTDYLADGVRDVVCRLMMVKPEEAPLFTKTTSAINHNDGTTVESGMVLDVVRTDGVTSGNLISADIMSAAQRYQATDPDSLHFRSKFNPAWYLQDKKVYIVPAPSDNSNKDDAFITFVTYDIDLEGLTSSGSIDNFPLKYQSLVVLYAACRVILYKMGLVISSISDYVSPVVSSTAAGGGATASADLTTMTDSNWEGLDFDFDDENIDFATWFQTAGDMIQRQEDIELATSQLDKIKTYLTAYQNAVSNAGNVFDKKFQKYQADYQWLGDRHQRLYAEYVGYFAAIMGQKQQQQQQQQQAQARRGR